MSKYSEVIGSFIRNGSFPLEADYVFASELELIEFYSEPENLELLHQGWFKIVGEGDNQALYWVVKEDDELKFVKLLERIDRDTIYDDLTELHAKLEQEIQDREDADSEIWGNKDSVISGLNNIELLSQAVSQLKTQMSTMINTVSHIIKGDDSLNLSNFVSYLQTLDYPSIEALSKALKKFLGEAGDLDDKINLLEEILHFLEGYEETDQLKTVLEKLVSDLMGTPLPAEEFRTLRGIEDFVRLLKSLSENTDSNLQRELDRTQVGVGLSQDGSFSPDKETYYLKDATSVMNALKTLDRLIHDNSIKVSNEAGNLIVVKADGIYHNIDIDIDEGILKVIINGSIVKTYSLGVSTIVEDGWYDQDTECLIIIFKKLNGESEKVRIPVGNLIREWNVDNNGPSKVVELTREEVLGGGADRLSADVRLSNNKDNILEKDGNTLLVRGTTDNITHNGLNLDRVIESLQSGKDDDNSGIYYIHGVQNGPGSLTITSSKSEIKKIVDKIVGEKEGSFLNNTSIVILKVQGLMDGEYIPTLMSYTFRGYSVLTLAYPYYYNNSYYGYYEIQIDSTGYAYTSWKPNYKIGENLTVNSNNELTTNFPGKIKLISNTGDVVAVVPLINESSNDYYYDSGEAVGIWDE